MYRVHTYFIIVFINIIISINLHSSSNGSIHKSPSNEDISSVVVNAQPTLSASATTPFNQVSVMTHSTVSGQRHAHDVHLDDDDTSACSAVQRPENARLLQPRAFNDDDLPIVRRVSSQHPYTLQPRPLTPTSDDFKLRRYQDPNMQRHTKDEWRALGRSSLKSFESHTSSKSSRSSTPGTTIAATTAAAASSSKQQTKIARCNPSNFFAPTRGGDGAASGFSSSLRLAGDALGGALVAQTLQNRSQAPARQTRFYVPGMEQAASGAASGLLGTIGKGIILTVGFYYVRKAVMGFSDWMCSDANKKVEDLQAKAISVNQQTASELSELQKRTDENLIRLEQDMQRRVLTAMARIDQEIERRRELRESVRQQAEAINEARERQYELARLTVNALQEARATETKPLDQPTHVEQNFNNDNDNSPPRRTSTDTFRQISADRDRAATPANEVVRQQQPITAAAIIQNAQTSINPNNLTAVQELRETDRPTTQRIMPQEQQPIISAAAASSSLTALQQLQAFTQGSRPAPLTLRPPTPIEQQEQQDLNAATTSTLTTSVLIPHQPKVHSICCCGCAQQ